MANVVPYAFKQGILKGQHDLSANNAYYLALYTTATPYAVSDSVYSSAVANQVGTSGTAYTTVDFTTDPTWTSSTITARTGVLYKYVAPGGTTADQYLVAILDFGGDITSTSGDFKVTFPSATAGSPSGSGALLSITGNP